MKKIKIGFTTIGLLASAILHSQDRGNAMYDKANNVYEGNAVYGNNYYNQYPKVNPGNHNYYLPNDSVYMIGTKVMINIQPDTYQAVFSITQEGLSISECNKLINERIDKFKSSLKSAGIKDEELFVDLIAQTRIYDYKIMGKSATEVKQGFEFKKNIIIKFIDHDLLEKMILLAADQEIFDIVKVDYIVSDVEKVQTQLRQAALELIENKKKFLTANSALALSDKGLIQYENFNTIFPSEGYRQYVAAESSNVQPSYYNSNTWVKEQRKSKTFYFEKLNPSSFDRVINPISVKVPVQVTLEMAFKFYIGKPEKRVRK